MGMYRRGRSPFGRNAQGIFWAHATFWLAKAWAQKISRLSRDRPIINLNHLNVRKKGRIDELQKS
jgi:hypothetical protein